MFRWDIINNLIKDNNYKSYKEIGFYKNYCFSRIDCDYKLAIDPNPCQNIEQEKEPYGSEIENTDGKIIKLTSDDYFKKFNEVTDIFFVDGLHEAEQVYNDLINCFNNLSEGGVVVAHDANPPKFEHTTTGIDGFWTGDTYKGILRFIQLGLHSIETIDTDWGVSIIRKGYNNIDKSFLQKGIESWDFFDKNRKELLNLKNGY